VRGVSKSTKPKSIALLCNMRIREIFCEIVGAKGLPIHSPAMIFDNFTADKLYTNIIMS
jgi:hypothetical protein